MTEIDVLLNGVSALGVLVSSILIGSYIFFKATKLNAKLLKYAGVMQILIGFLWLGPSADFIMILTTGSNIQPKEIYAFLSYLWVVPAILLAMNIGSELIAPDKKRIIMGIVLIVSIVFLIGLFGFYQDGYTFNYTVPNVSGDNIIDTSFNPKFFSFYALAIILVFVVLFNGIGSLLKAKDSSGILKKKFIFLALGFIIFPVAAVFDTLVGIVALLPVVRTLVIISGILLYLGLKP